MDYVGAENPTLHVVCVQPGWIPTEMTGFTEAAPDSGKRTNRIVTFIGICSYLARSILCMSSIFRSGLSEGQDRMGKLGCGGTYQVGKRTGEIGLECIWGSTIACSIYLCLCVFLRARSRGLRCIDLLNTTHQTGYEIGVKQEGLIFYPCLLH